MLESLRELREFADAPDSGYWHDEIIELADRIEREIERDYMPRPCDRDGVPIHIGDELSHDGFTRNFIVHSYELTDGAWSVWDVANGATHLCNACRHVKPRTVEDVICDALSDASCMGDGIVHTFKPDEPCVVAICTEIRELLSKEGA